jgi:hypothetical protein
MKADKIFDANDKAKDEGFTDAKDRLQNYHLRAPRRGGVIVAFAWEGNTTKKDPVLAYVERGRWLADCECGNAEWVAENIPFFCRNCGNQEHNGDGRDVMFPENKSEIEQELLTRKIHMRGGRSETERVIQAKPDNLLLGREWRVGESVQDLKDQKAMVMNSLFGGE